MTSVRYEIDPDEAYGMANQGLPLRQEKGEFMEQLELDFEREFGTGDIQRDGTG